MVKGEHRKQLALRPDLHAPLARLGDDVVVGPCQRLRRLAQRPAVELSGPLEARLPRGALDRPAVRWVGAVPYSPPRPAWHLLLGHGD
eukprot:6207714-Pleurochrysis_carterae.AAC.1